MNATQAGLGGWWRCLARNSCNPTWQSVQLFFAPSRFRQLGCWCGDPKPDLRIRAAVVRGRNKPLPWLSCRRLIDYAWGGQGACLHGSYLGHVVLQSCVVQLRSFRKACCLSVIIPWESRWLMSFVLTICSRTLQTTLLVDSDLDLPCSPS